MISQVGGQLQILISTTLGVHTPKHNSLRQNRQARQFQILITHSKANDPTTQLITTHKISCLNSFGTCSFCTTLWHSFTVSTATNRRHDQWRTQEFFFGEGSTNSIEVKGKRRWGSGGCSPLVRGSGGSYNLVQEISFCIVKFSKFLVLQAIYDDNQFICHF